MEHDQNVLTQVPGLFFLSLTQGPGTATIRTMETMPRAISNVRSLCAPGTEHIANEIAENHRRLWTRLHLERKPRKGTIPLSPYTSPGTILFKSSRVGRTLSSAVSAVDSDFGMSIPSEYRVLAPWF